MHSASRKKTLLKGVRIELLRAGPSEGAKRPNVSPQATAAVMVKALEAKCYHPQVQLLNRGSNRYGATEKQEVSHDFVAGFLLFL